MHACMYIDPFLCAQWRTVHYLSFLFFYQTELNVWAKYAQVFAEPFLASCRRFTQGFIMVLFPKEGRCIIIYIYIVGTNNSFFYACSPTGYSLHSKLQIISSSRCFHTKFSIYVDTRCVQINSEYGVPKNQSDRLTIWNEGSAYLQTQMFIHFSCILGV